MQKQSSSGSLPEVKQDVAAAMVVNPFLATVLEWFDGQWSEHEDLYSIIMSSLFPTSGQQAAWADFLNQTFPPEPDVNYLLDWGGPGVKNIRPFMWAWVPSAGNILQSILVKGLVTDVLQPGVELPIIAPGRQELRASQDMICEQVEISSDVAKAYSVHEIKGWSRACAMHLTIFGVKELGLLDDYKKFLGPKLINFQTQKANYMAILPEGKDEVDINRGVGLGMG